MKKTLAIIIAIAAIAVILFLLTQKQPAQGADEERGYGSNVRTFQGEDGSVITQSIVDQYTTQDYIVIATDAHADAKTLPVYPAAWTPVASIDQAHWHNLVEQYQLRFNCSPASDIEKIFRLSSKVLKTGFYKPSFDGIRAQLEQRKNWI